MGAPSAQKYDWQLRTPNRHGGKDESALSQSAQVEMVPNTMIGTLVRIPLDFLMGMPTGMAGRV